MEQEELLRVRAKHQNRLKRLKKLVDKEFVVPPTKKVKTLNLHRI